jgi:hypothetical protein
MASFKRSWVVSTVLAASVGAGGCAGDASRRAGESGPASSVTALCRSLEGARLWERTELFFGLSKPDGSPISDAEYQRFLDTEITPRFSDGFTLLNGNGHYRSASGEIIREPSRVVILFYPYDRAKSAAADEIRAAYRKQFQQESVLRADSPSCVGF